MLGAQTHGIANPSHKKETEVQRDLVTCWRLWFTYQEIAFSRHPNAKSVCLPHPALPVTMPGPVPGAGLTRVHGGRVRPAIRELTGSLREVSEEHG